MRATEVMVGSSRNEEFLMESALALGMGKYSTYLGPQMQAGLLL